MDTQLICPHFDECECKCIQINDKIGPENDKSQQKWCRLQDKIFERIELNDIKGAKKEAWVFIISLREIMKTTIKQFAAAKSVYLPVRELLGDETERLAQTIMRKIDKGTLKPIRKVKGYIKLRMRHVIFDELRHINSNLLYARMNTVLKLIEHKHKKIDQERERDE